MAGNGVPRFRNRGDSVSRLKGFSDSAFGFAITLLVVSLTVPTRFQELPQQLSGLPVFAVTFALVATIWYAVPARKAGNQIAGALGVLGTA